jgi:RNA polymerase sigma factor (sigma-70 family)
LALMRAQTDERLVDLARAGNQRAFEAIVERYRRPLLRYCSRLLPPTRAEDVVQQALLNAYAAMLRDDRRIELRPWLYRIAHNAALNALRENGWSHERIESVLAGTDTTHETVERRASLETVLTAVQMLPERQRDAMILREIEGRSYEQIAIQLDATGGAVRQLLHRARHTVRTAATALTPVGLLTRLPWGGAVAERVSDAAVQETMRAGAGRVAGGVVAAIAVAAGLSEAPKHLRIPAGPAWHRSPGSGHAARGAASALSATARGPVVRIERHADGTVEVAGGPSRPKRAGGLIAPDDAAPVVKAGGDGGGFAPRSVTPAIIEPSSPAPLAAPPAPASAAEPSAAPPPAEGQSAAASPPADDSPTGRRHRRPRWRSPESPGNARQHDDPQAAPDEQPTGDGDPADTSSGSSAAGSADAGATPAEPGTTAQSAPADSSQSQTDGRDLRYSDTRSTGS